MRHAQPTAAIDRAREAFALSEVSVSVWGSRRKPVLCQHPAWPLHSPILHSAWCQALQAGISTHRKLDCRDAVRSLAGVRRQSRSSIPQVPHWWNTWRQPQRFSAWQGFLSQSPVGSHLSRDALCTQGSLRAAFLSCSTSPGLAGACVSPGISWGAQPWCNQRNELKIRGGCRQRRKAELHFPECSWHCRGKG